MIGESERHRIVFGCGNFGGMGSSPALRGLGDAPDEASRLLDTARAVGLTRFDTANTYGGGVSETVLGDWLRRQGPAFRATIQVATKVGNPNGCPPGDTPLSRAQVAFHLDQSLIRLGLERIDLYYLHEFDHVTPLEETLEAISRALAAGKIGAFGVSNARPDDLAAVLRLADTAVLSAFTHIQNEFNALETGDAETIIPIATARGLRYTAFSPLAGGLLTGKYRLDATPGAGTRLGEATAHYAHYLTPRTFHTIDALRASAEQQGSTLAGAALRFILDTPGVDSLIIAPRKASHFDSYGLSPEAARP